MDTILVAVDESDGAARAAAIATDLAAALGSRLVVVSVLDGDPERAGAVRVVQRRVQDLGLDLGIDVDVRSVRGRPAEELVRQARTVAADVVVVGRTSTGRGDGSGIAEEVLASCHVPVLVVPSGEADAGDHA